MAWTNVHLYKSYRCIKSSVPKLTRKTLTGSYLLKQKICLKHCSIVVRQRLPVKHPPGGSSGQKSPRQMEALSGERRLGMVEGRLPSRLGGPRRAMWAGWKRILAYFEGHRTLLFALICRCFEFVKQCFMSHGGRARFGENCPPSQRRTVPDFIHRCTLR